MSTYLSTENLSKQYGEKPLFEGLTFGISKGDKTALIAQNGTGKSTLMRILAGKETPDTGEVMVRNGITVRLLEQEPEMDEHMTISEYMAHDDNETVQVVREYERAVKAQAENYSEETQKAFDRAMSKMDAINAWDYEARLSQILGVLNIHDLDQPISTLSGGQKKRVALAFVLIDNPDLLILDEPTNHLDVRMIEWLEDYLKRSTMTLLMVTHDRYFLDRVCDHILEMENNTLYHHKGNYAYFLQKKKEREEVEATEIAKAKKLAKTEQEWMRRQPKARTTKSKSRINAFHETKEKAGSGKVQQEIQLDMDMARMGGKILKLVNVSKSFGDNVILDGFEYSFQKGERIGILGKNGVGKSTFLKVLMEQLPIDTGKVIKGETIVFGHYSQDGIEIKEDQRVIDVVKDVAEVIETAQGDKISAGRFLEHFLFDRKKQYTPVAKLSGGEKRRLGLMKVLLKNPNFLILDEPTNDLDLLTLEKLEAFLGAFNGCLIIVSHDRFFMDSLVDHYFVFEGDGKIRDFNGTYSEYRDAVMEEEMQQKENSSSAKKPSTVKNTPVKEEKTDQPKKLSYTERKEYNNLEKKIIGLEENKEALEQDMADASKSYEEIQDLSGQYEALKEEIEELEMRWMELAERA